MVYLDCSCCTSYSQHGSLKNYSKTPPANRENMEEESSAKTEENVAKTTWSTMLMPSAILSGVSLSFTSIAHLLMTIVGGVLCFLPCFLGTPSCVETSILRASLSSVEYGYAAVTLIISAAPLIIEMIIDGFLHVYRSSFIQNKQQSSFILDTNVIAPYTYSFNTPEKVLFIVGIIIQPLVAFLPSDTNNLGQLYICCNKCQIMLVAGTFNTWLCRYDPRHFSVCTAYMFLGVLVVSMSLQVFGDNMSNCSNLDQVTISSSIIELFVHFFHHNIFCLPIYPSFSGLPQHGNFETSGVLSRLGVCRYFFLQRDSLVVLQSTHAVATCPNGPWHHVQRHSLRTQPPVVLQLIRHL